MSVRQIFQISAILLLVSTFVAVVANVEIANSNKVKEISNYNSLASFNQAEGVADMITGLITINDEQSYAAEYEIFKKVMTNNLLSEYFPTSTYQGGQKNVNIVINSTEAEIEGASSFLVKLNLTIENSSTSDQVVMLVQVSGGIITSIQTL